VPIAPHRAISRRRDRALNSSASSIGAGKFSVVSGLFSEEHRIPSPQAEKISSTWLFFVVTLDSQGFGDSIVTMGRDITESGVPHDGNTAAIVTKSAREWPLQQFSKCMAPDLSSGAGPVNSILP
jgi:hypothetical protein